MVGRGWWWGEGVAELGVCPRARSLCLISTVRRAKLSGAEKSALKSY